MEETLDNAQKKEKYKAIHEFINSDGYNNVIEYCKIKEAEAVKQIEKEFDKRKKVVSEYSELNKYKAYADFMLDVSKMFDESEWGKILKQDFLDQHQSAMNMVYIKEYSDDEGKLYDVPMFTTLDILKVTRRLYHLIKNKIQEMHDVYSVEKKKEVESLHPYEE